MDIGIVQELFKIEAARARGEPVSDFKIARLYVDSMWIELADMLDSGVPKTDVVGVLTITARVNRTAAYNVLSNKINSAKNRKRKTNSEVSKKVFGHESGSAPAVPVPTKSVERKPVAQVPRTTTPTDKNSVSTESSSQPASSIFKGGIKIGNNFHGIDDVGKQAEQDREERRKARDGLEAMEKQYGKPKF